MGPAARAAVLPDPGLGRQFSDHLVTVEHDPDRCWHAARVRPYGPLALMLAWSALQYAQQVFEGLKAYRHADGSVWTFRPAANAERLRASAGRLQLLAPDDELVVESLRQLVALDYVCVPDGETGRSLYLLPFVIGTEQFLGVRPSRTLTFGVIAAPAGSICAGGAAPVDVWVSTRHTRAAPGSITEVFACGTAAVVTPVARLKGDGFTLDAARDTAGPVTTGLRQRLTNIQFGHIEDTRGWLVRLR